MNKKIFRLITMIPVMVSPIAIVVSCSSGTTYNLDKILKSNNVEETYKLIKSFIDKVNSGDISSFIYKQKEHTRKNEDEFKKTLNELTKNVLQSAFPTLVQGTDPSLVDIGFGFDDVITDSSPTGLFDSFQLPKNMHKPPKNTHFVFANDLFLMDKDPSKPNPVSHWTPNIGNFKRGQQFKTAGKIIFKVKLVANTGYSIAAPREFKLIFNVKNVK